MVMPASKPVEPLTRARTPAVTIHSHLLSVLLVESLGGFYLDSRPLADPVVPTPKTSPHLRHLISVSSVKP